MKVIIVDDSAAMRELLRDLIVPLGHECTLCKNGKDFLDLIKNQTYDIICLDWELPDIKGPDLCKRARLNKNTTNSIIMMITGRSTENDLKEVLKAGADDFITKPIEYNLLTTRLNIAALRYTERLNKLKVQEEIERLATTPRTNPNPLMETDLNGNPLIANPASLRLFPDLFEKKINHPILKELKKQITNYKVDKPYNHYCEVIVGDKTFEQKIAFLPKMGLIRIYATDITKRKNIENALRKSKNDLEIAHENLKNQQAQLVQSKKMASLGQLAAGIAHEINNPIGFIISNSSTLNEYILSFLRIIKKYESLTSDNEFFNHSEMKTIYEEEDYEYIQQDIYQLFNESYEGLNRIKEIVQNLKSFARLDEAIEKEFDINEGLESTLKIAWNEIKYRSTVIKNFKPLPQIKCHPGKLNQVFLNLLINASQAIKGRGTITIDTLASDHNVIIKISDTGCGIPEENLERLFNPFFTTKPIGEGTGLGLSIAYGIIKDHNGTIEVESTPNIGTTFIIKLPIIKEANHEAAHSLSC